MFTQAKKRPDKRKPMKLTGISGSSEFTDALTSVLENPAAFVGDTTLEAIDGSLDADLVKLQTDSRGQALGFSTGNLAGFLNDPNKFIKKAYEKQKMMRKASNIRWLSPAVQDVITRAYAHRMGLVSEDGTLLGEATRKALAEIQYGSMSSGNQFYSQNYTLGASARLNNVDPAATLDLNAKTLEMKSKGRITDENDYIGAVKEHLKDKATADPSKKDTYQKASLLLDNLRDQAIIKRSPIELKATRKAIRELRKVNPNDPALRELLADEKRLQVLSRQNLLGNIGQAEGFVNAWNATYRTTKDLVPSILNGSFFEDAQHKNPFLTPSIKRTARILNEKGEWEKIKFHDAIKSKTIYNPRVAEFLNNIYYYTPAGIISSLTTGEGFARSYQKTLDRLTASVQGLDSANINMLKSFGMFDDQGNFKAENWALIASDPTKMSALASFVSANPNNPIAKNLLNTVNRSKVLNNLAYRFQAVSRWNAKITTAVLTRLNNRLKTNIAQDKLSDYTAGQIINKFLGEKLLNGKLGAFLAKHLSADIMKQLAVEVGSGGLKVLISSTLKAAMAAAGMALGPLASVLAWVGTEVIVEIGYKMIGQIILLILLLTLGIIGIGFMGIGGLGEVLSGLAPHSYITPVEVKQCDAFFGIEPIIDDPDDEIERGPIEDFVAGSLPSGVQCLLGEGSYSCSQGAYGSWSHQQVAANDYTGVSYFHAPTFCGEGNCVVTYVGDVNCTSGYAGGMVKFTATYEGSTYEFKLIHVASDFSVGQTLGAGERVARVMTIQETGNACSTGMHLHLETKLNGATVDPYDVMTSPTSAGGFGCSISECP